MPWLPVSCGVREGKDNIIMHCLQWERREKSCSYCLLSLRPRPCRHHHQTTGVRSSKAGERAVELGYARRQDLKQGKQLKDHQCSCASPGDEVIALVRGGGGITSHRSRNSLPLASKSNNSVKNNTATFASFSF